MGLLIIVSAVLWAQMNGQSFHVNPWDIDSDVIMLRFPFQWCVGQRRNCAGFRGAASVWAPILLNNTWRIDQTASGAMRISDATKAIMYLQSSGGIVVGPDELPSESGVTVALVPAAYAATPMWNSHATMTFSDGTILDSVCHVKDGSMCGTLLRTSILDAGIFTSKSRVIVGTVEYGFITANLQARVILNSSIVITQYNLSAVPCCGSSNIPIPRCPPPPPTTMTTTTTTTPTTTATTTTTTMTTTATTTTAPGCYWGCNIDGTVGITTFSDLDACNVAVNAGVCFLNHCSKFTFNGDPCP